MVQCAAVVRHRGRDQYQRGDGLTQGVALTPASAFTAAFGDGRRGRGCVAGWACASVEPPALRVCPFGPVSFVPAHTLWHRRMRDCVHATPGKFGRMFSTARIRTEESIWQRGVATLPWGTTGVIGAETRGVECLVSCTMASVMETQPRGEPCLWRLTKLQASLRILVRRRRAIDVRLRRSEASSPFNVARP